MTTQAPAALRRIVLVGRPNVGKSVLFHALTGEYATVSNYGGTTLDLRRARIEGAGLEVLDTPGLFALSARTDDEAVTRDELLTQTPECVVCVGNASDVEGAAAFVLDLARLRVPVVLVLNLQDEAAAKGLFPDAEALSTLLGVPVMATVATLGRGVRELKRAIEERRGSVPALAPMPVELERSASRLEAALPQSCRALALLALTGDDGIRRGLKAAGRFDEAGLELVERERRTFSRNPSFLYANSARAYAQELAARTLKRREPGAGAGARFLEKLGRWSLGPRSGPALALGVLWLLYEFVGVFGAQTAVEFIEESLFGARINPAITALAQRLIPWVFLRDALVGPYGAFTMAVTYAFALVLPIVTTFFIAFSLLEDSGYLPRFSVVTDRFFRLMGLNGKAVLPMMLGLGCGTMAIVTTRILETRRERLLVSFLLALTVPCSAQLGVILGMTGGSPASVTLVWLAVIGFTLVVVGLSASRLIPGAAASFVLEIPPMRVPQALNVLRKVAMRLKWYLLEIVPLFIYATFALFLLDRAGLLAHIERAASPLMQGLLGLPKEATSAFLVGFFRRDYGAAGLFQMHREGMLSPRQVAVSLACITLFMPCVAQWLVTLREHGAKVTAVITVFVFSYALLVAAFINHVWLHFGGV
ncbi:MAG: ferrous iron transport protein B [Elusimicrobiota bacterium]